MKSFWRIYWRDVNGKHTVIVAAYSRWQALDVFEEITTIKQTRVQCAWVSFKDGTRLQQRADTPFYDVDQLTLFNRIV